MLALSTRAYCFEPGVRSSVARSREGDSYSSIAKKRSNVYLSLMISGIRERIH
jgi:hypothetical protein